MFLISFYEKGNEIKTKTYFMMTQVYEIKMAAAHFCDDYHGEYVRRPPPQTIWKCYNKLHRRDCLYTVEPQVPCEGPTDCKQLTTLRLAFWPLKEAGFGLFQANTETH